MQSDLSNVSWSHFSAFMLSGCNHLDYSDRNSVERFVKQANIPLNIEGREEPGLQSEGYSRRGVIFLVLHRSCGWNEEWVLGFGRQEEDGEAKVMGKVL